MSWLFSKALGTIRTIEEQLSTDAATTVQYDASMEEDTTVFPDSKTKNKIHISKPSLEPFLTCRNVTSFFKPEFCHYIVVVLQILLCGPL